jgi:dodecin
MIRAGGQEHNRKEQAMTVAKVSEITSSSSKGFADAIAKGIKRADKTLKNVTSAWIADQEVQITKGKVTEYRVRLRITFILEG